MEPKLKTVKEMIEHENTPEEDRAEQKANARNAYRQGYLNAMWDLERLYENGYRTKKEQLNRLENHGGLVLKSWVVSPDEAHSALPPEHHAPRIVIERKK